MLPNRSASFLRLSLLLVFLAGMVFQPQFNAHAAANLTITPLTWNVVGLDSNNVNVGPNNFPVGARVCNTGDTTATNVSSTFNWEAIDPTPAQNYINLRPGSNTSYSGYTLAPSACVDFYYEVQVTRNSNAYNDTRQYYITATADTLGTISTPRPREFFVEHLISQNRNAISDVRLDGVSTPAGGTMNLMVGNTYTIQLVGSTATQGYEQLESFINFPNTIFQVNSVTSTYSASAGTDPLATTRPYADGCNWVNDPGSPNYRSCVATGKYGGNITVTYNVTILGGAGTNQTLNTLIYDFSGSSYHYNADFSTGVRFASIIGPSSVEITKMFSPKAIPPGGTSVLTFKLTNPTTETVTGANFTDSLLGGLRVAATPNLSYSGCGAGAFSPAPVVDATSLSFANGTIAPNSTCTIMVTVTADTAADYPNATSNLFINTSLDTGNSASDTLKVSSASACVPGQTLATWTFPSGSSATAPVFTTKAANVTTATASTTTTASTIDTNVGSPAPSWAGRNFPGSGAVTGDTSPYFQFVIDTSKYSGVQVSLSYARDSNWGGGGATIPAIYVWSSTTGGAGSFSQIFASATFDTTFRSTGNLNAAATGASLTYFRINAVGATNANAYMQIDTVTFTGCLVPAPAPTMTKSFSPDPIVRSANSTLTFTINNTAVGNVAQTGISFTDVLPDGLSVANGTASACNGTNNLVTTAATRTIALTGGSLAAGGSCTFNVTVTGTVEGAYENITGFLSSTESGTSTSYATDTLTVIAPPDLEKSFSPSSILTGATSVLQFTITNPNQGTVLTGIGFTDTLPAGVTAVDGNFNYCNGTLSITGGNLLTFTGGSINANSTCTFTVTMTGMTTGTKPNTTSAITSTQGGNGNTASATLVVSNPQSLIGLLKQISPDSANWVKYLGLIPPDDIYYRFTITNDGETTLDNISVTDPNVNMGACLPALPTSLAVGDSASCVVGPISISAVPAPDPFVNTATVTTSTYAPGAEGSSSAQYGTMSLSLDKTADRSVFFVELEVITYTYLVTNSGGYPLLGPVTVTDDQTTVTCPGVSTVGDNDNYLDPGESLTCTATYPVSAGDVTAGRVTNTASASVDGITSNTDSVTVNLPPDLTVTKTNNVSGSVALGNSFDWTITVTNAGVADAVFADGHTIVSDPLPAGATYNPILIMGGGIFSQLACAINGGTLSCTASGGAVTLSEGASFSVTVAVTPTAAGSLANTATVDPNGDITELDEASNSSTNVLTVVAPALIEKQFIPEDIVVGGTSTLTFTIFNPNTGVDLTGVAFTDPLPSGLQVASPPTPSTSGCGAPAFNPAATDTVISFSGGTIAASASCTISVTVTATTSGTKSNTTGNVTSTNGGTGNTASYALHVFEAQPTKSLVSTSESFTALVATTERVAIGELIRYRLAALIPEGPFTNVQLLDGLPTGLQFLADDTATVAFVCNGSTNCMSSSTLSGAGLVVSGASNAVLPTFTIPGAAISGGPFGSGTDVTFSVGNVTNSDADADAEYIVIEFNALVMNVNSGVTINQGVDNQTGTSNANNRQNDVTLQINGSTVGATSGNVTVAIAEPAITAITKSVAPAAGPYLPGDALTYTLSFSNNATGNNATTAFDIVLTDTFDPNLTLGAVNVSSSQGATCSGGTAFSTGSSTVGQVVTENITCLDPGSSVTVTVNATISGSTPSGTTISNSASLTYTSLPGTQGSCSIAPFLCSGVGSTGSGTGERNGSGGPGADGTVLNNYAVTSNTVNVAVDYGSVTITKDAIPDSAQDFNFSGGGTLTNFDFGGGFSLDDDADGTLPNTQTFPNLLPDQITLTEDLVSGWLLTNLTCTDPDNGSSVILPNRTATIDLEAGENVNCTFTNTQIAPPVISKDFSPDPITVNGTSTLTFTITNPNSFTDLSGVGFTDPLPAGLEVASTPNSSTSAECGSPTFAPGIGDTNLTFSGGTIPASGTCTVSVDVTATTDGLKNNTTDPVTSSNGGTGNTANDALTVSPLADLVVTKTDGTTNVPSGAATTYTLTLTNNGPSAADASTIGDPAVNGLTKTALGACSATGGAVCPLTGAGAGELSITNLEAGTVIVPTLPSGGSISFSVNVSVTAASGTVANAFTATPPVGISDPTPASSTDTNTVIGIDAVNDTGAIIDGALGGQSLANVLVNDTLNGASATLVNIILTQVATTNPGVTLDPATGSVNVVPGTPAGNYTVTYQICDQLNPTICDTAAVTVPVVVIDAVNDDFSSTPVNGSTGGTTATLFTNDTLNGSPFGPAAVVPSITDDGGSGGTINADGTLSLPAGTPAGTYTITYQICDQANPTICDTANITIVVNPPLIDAVNDDLSATPINGSVGGNAGNAFSNDTLNGVIIVPAQITALIVTPASNAGVTLNISTGSVDIATGTPADTYTVDYQICENLNPTNCDTATITVVVGIPGINLTKTPTLDMTVVAPNGIVNAGDTITYGFAVQNSGSLAMTNIVVTDPLLPALSCVIASLAPGATASCAVTNNVYTLTQADLDNGSRANSASVTGQDPGGNAVTDIGTSTVTLTSSPSILLTKTPAVDDTVVAPGGVVNAGDTITYTFSVENTGSVTITNINVTDPLLPTLSCTIASLAPAATLACSATNNVYTLTQADVDAGSRVNTATATGQDPGNNPVTDTDTQTTLLSQTPSLNIAKEVSADNLTWNDVSVSVLIGDTVYYRVRVANTGNVTLTSLVVDDGMAACTLVRGPDITGNNDAVFEAGEEWVYGCSVTAVAGTNINTATADTTETTRDSDAASYTGAAALVADPALSKAGSPTQAAVGETVTFTLTVTNAGNTPAPNVVITDVLPAMFDVTAVNLSGAPLFGTSVNVTPPIGTGPAPYTVVVTLGSSLGVTDVLTIDIVTTVNSLGNLPVSNAASLSTSAVTDVISNNAADVTITIRSPGVNSSVSNRPALLPATGFAPNVQTELPAQPHDISYGATDVVLEIPSLGIKLPIVGVPKKNGTWDVTWLGKQAGWLEGSAFPSWNGNSVLTSHVYDSYGRPGPFVNLGTLKFGDPIIVHAYGQKYIFEVQTNQVVVPNDRSAFKHEDKPWLTLITCKAYDEKSKTYRQRLIVRAVLVKVLQDK
jgi:LPXTG-site transpeptidase (sortase) family protein